MKILIVTAVFSPEPVVSAKLSEDLAHELSKTNTVSVISPKPTRPFGFKLNEKDINKSYSLINLDSYTCPESNVYGRFKESYSFGLACSKYIKENINSNFIRPIVDKDYYDVYHIFNIRHPRRDDLKEFLLKNKIQTEIHYPIAPHRQKALKGLFNGEYPISEEIHKTTLSLPISYCHTEDDIFRVVECINSF